MKRELMLICQVCSYVISSNDGYLSADMVEVGAAGRARREWLAKHTDSDGSLGMDLLDLLDHPEEVRWQAHHQACDPAAERTHYRLAAEKLHTRADLLDWTAHLMGKDWLPLTDWTDVIQEARTGGKRIAVVGP